jgi:hypothetical protein
MQETQLLLAFDRDACARLDASCNRPIDPRAPEL